jgi:putative transposase
MYGHYCVRYFCTLFGKSRQAWYEQCAVDALIMAASKSKRQQSLIHHSDRGVQYCCADYVQMLEHFGINISMTENGDPYENAIAERVNGILKTEFLLSKTFATYSEATAAVDIAIDKYNHVRPHASCNYLTPAMAHEQSGLLQKRWKKKVYAHQSNMPAGGLHITNE